MQRSAFAVLPAGPCPTKMAGSAAGRVPAGEQLGARKMLQRHRLNALPLRTAKRGAQGARRVSISAVAATAAPVNDEEPKTYTIGSYSRELRHLAGDFWRGPTAKAAWSWSCATFVLAVARALFAVSLSFLQRKFWTALSARDPVAFNKMLRVMGVAVVIGPIVLTLFEWCKDKLIQNWRKQLTNKLIGQYMSNLNYYRITAVDGQLDNPDQRLSDNIAAFSDKAVSMLCNVTVTLLDFALFATILYRLYAPLFWMLVLYSSLGTSLTVYFGRRLASLNAKQLACEADFRYSLVHVRDNAESIAFYAGEQREERSVSGNFARAMSNFTELIGLKRNVGFLTTGYQYFVNVLPSLVVAPVYFKGGLELGIMSQVYFSFNHVLQGLGLVVREFVNLSSFAADVRRIAELRSAIERPAASMGSDEAAHSGAHVVSRAERSNGGGSALELQHLSVLTPSHPPRELLKDVSCSLVAGRRLLVVGESGIGKSSLMRVIAGLWSHGEGKVTVSAPEATLFLPQRPYVTLGSLRENLAYPKDATAYADTQLRDALKRVNLSRLESMLGGLDLALSNLSGRLSTGEQQRLAFARVLLTNPELVIIDEGTSGLDVENEKLMYTVLPRATTVLSFGNRPTLLQYHDDVLRILPEGRWRLESAEEARRKAFNFA